MSDIYNELKAISDSMERLRERGCKRDIQHPLAMLERAAEEVGRTWSGSWIGDHASTYYRNFQVPPSGANFSQEWGSIPAPFNPTVGDWIVFDPVFISEAVFERAGNPNMDSANEFHIISAREFDTQKLNSISILEVYLSVQEDTFIIELKALIDSLTRPTFQGELGRWSPKNRVTRDLSALSQNNQIVPPHISIRSQVRVIRGVLEVVASLASLSKQAAAHIHRLNQARRVGEATVSTGTKIFVGHGRSQVWLELEKFLTDRLNLEVDEFNRVSPAGISTIERLAEMLDEANFAFLVMTGEDEQPAGRFSPRMNVVHEAGLFQSRLGFERAIVLLEEGCEEFSNIAGLGQIRFPEGKIAATFEEIRMVLEREGLLGAPGQGASG